MPRKPHELETSFFPLSHRPGRYLIGVLLTALAVLLLMGCDLPRDIEGTEDRVRQGVLRVGVIDGVAPWAAWHSGTPRGVEVQLVRELAERTESDIRWVSGSDTELFHALAAFELDLVIGGVDRTTPWRKEVALTRPYYVSRVMVGWPSGGSEERSIDGVRIAVKPHTSVVKKLEDRGAVPVELQGQPSDQLPVAAEEWQIKAWGRQPSPPKLDTHKRVFALPPGENGWLHTVQRFLFEKRAEVPAMIRSQSTITNSRSRTRSTLSEVASR